MITRPIEAMTETAASISGGNLEQRAEPVGPRVKTAYKLKTEIGKAVYRLRKSTVEPVIGIIKEVLGWRRCWHPGSLWQLESRMYVNLGKGIVEPIKGICRGATHEAKTQRGSVE